MHRLLCTLLLLGMSCQLCYAQWGTPAAQDPRVIAEQKKKSKDRFRTTALKKFMEIPNVPIYPSMRDKGSAKFIRAQKYSSLGSGDNCIVQSVLLKDQPDMVRDWYRQSLTNQGWSVKSANATNTQILARKVKEGASLHVMVGNSTEKPYKSVLQLRYSQFQPITTQEE